MIICKDGCYAYCGATANEAYEAYLSANDDHDNRPPAELEWYSATEMQLNMRLEPAKKPPIKKAEK